MGKGAARTRFGSLLAAGLLMHGAPVAAADRVLTVTSTSTITTMDPYAESESQLYFIWCQVYGCLGRLDYEKKAFVGMLAEKWDVINDGHTWRFTLRTDLKRSDGGPGPTARDVVHSWNRIMTDPDSQQRFLFASVKDVVAVDDKTVDINTKTPSSQLPADIFGQFAITSADLYETHGKAGYKSHPFGWGPYKYEDFAVDQRYVIRKNELWPDKRPEAPDVVVYRQMREAEQRVTALLNNEVQVARLVPPQLVARLQGRPDVKIVPTGSVEIMFVAFSPASKPWDDVRVRRAAAHAINRDAIIQRLLLGYADPLDGPLGPHQFCYTEGAKSAARFDPKRARELLAEAGFAKGGPEVEFYSSTGRYISDRQISEAVAQMLQQVGFKVSLKTPEWANLWSNVRNGRVPAYYMGRGQVADPAVALSQYFETGVSPRIKYSSAEVDGLFQKARATFEPEKRCEIMRQVADKLAEDVPAQFLWSHRLINGVRSNVDWPNDPSGEAWWLDVKMR
ncbi:MAG: peptide transporter substrate-binding protein [Hyphomicrobiales bacterium]|nr:peptide transporter substrate-binding protein [Hyphomicrobiales bacterium]